MKRRVYRLACALLIALTATAAAQQDGKETAKRHYSAGMSKFMLERYDEAIKEFEEGWIAVPDPVFLYNLAQCYRLSKQPEPALGYYKKYLRLSPNARNRVEVEAHIVTLTKLAKLSVEGQKPPRTVMPLEKDSPRGRRETSAAAPENAARVEPKAETKVDVRPSERRVETRPVRAEPVRAEPVTSVPRPAVVVNEPIVTSAPPPAAAPKRKAWPGVVGGVVVGVVVIGGAVGLGVGLVSSQPVEPSAFVSLR